MRRLLLLCLVFVLAACGPRKEGEPVIYGPTRAVADLQVAYGYPYQYFSARYATVQEDWVKAAYADFVDELSRGQFGIIRWNERAKCTLFAFSFMSFAQRRYFAHSWGKNVDAETIAVGVFCYRPQPERFDLPGHAVCEIITPNGRRFFEPQEGKFVVLTQAQIDSCFARIFM